MSEDLPRRYRELVERVPVGLFRATPEGRLLEANPAFAAIFGYPDRASILAEPTLRDSLAEEDRLRLGLALRTNGGMVDDFAAPIRRRDGVVIRCRMSVRAVHEDGVLTCFEGMLQDVTESWCSQHALELSEERFRSLVQNASDMIALLDGEGRVLYESPSTERVLGYDVASRLGASALDNIHPEDLPLVRAALTEVLARPGARLGIEFRIRHQDGRWRVVESVATNLMDNPAVAGVVVNSRDVTDRRRAAEQLARGALRDGLTGLPNRALFRDRLHQAVEWVRRDPRKMFAVLYVDLDRFKLVNDSLGHNIGDELLVLVSRQLLRATRPTDTLARLGGDEFGLLLEEIEDPSEALRVAERLHEELLSPFRLGDHEVFASVSIGIALSGSPPASSEHLERNADTALHRAKARGGASHVVFDEAMHAVALERLRLETELRRAVERNELEVWFQPIASLPARRIVGFEALVRWRHPERGHVLPDEFLEVAEETGLILPIGDLVLREACRAIAAWNAEADAGEEPLYVSVNLSHRQFFDPALIERVERALTAFAVPRGGLAIEVTEGVLMKDEVNVARLLGELKARGLRLLLDDFGTGYSSLASLHRFPFDVLKIDRSFVGRLGIDAGLVHAVVTLARALDLAVIAEGVETAAQEAELVSHGCSLGQGWLLARALPAAQAAALLAAGGVCGSPSGEVVLRPSGQAPDRRSTA